MHLLSSRRGILKGTLALIAVARTLGPAGRRLALPQGPMIFTRVLTRELHDGKQVIVTRKWRIEFAQLEIGFEIIGKQVFVKVDAPERVRAIAQIEEKRPTDEMFPIVLNDEGAIERIGEIDNSASIQAAADKARQVISALSRSEDEKAQMREVIMRLEHAKEDILGSMPSDLFFPHRLQFSESKQLSLPDGSLGKFTVSYHAIVSLAGPWLQHARRHIKTQIGENCRNSYEVWTLEKA